MLKGLFAKEEVNTSRQWSFDFAKFVAIVGMVLVHTFIYIWNEEYMEQGPQYRLNNIYGGVLAAPVFIFAMGVGIAYSRILKVARTIADLAGSEKVESMHFA